jgi:CRISPR/Cas system-associated protein Csx1
MIEMMKKLKKLLIKWLLKDIYLLVIVTKEGRNYEVHYDYQSAFWSSQEIVKRRYSNIENKYIRKMELK